MDSRKRPLDSEGEEESESGVVKKSNPGSVDQVHFKVLIPSVAAGAIIGKGGEAVGKLQQDTGTKIKMSKAQEFYPGTHDRICLIVGQVQPILEAVESVITRIRAKPDSNPKPEMDGKVNLERHKQAKVLITNSSAGMVIGKGGNYIREIKEKSGAYVQVSQKSRDPGMMERIVTVSGEENQIIQAVELILQKVADDPQNGNYPNLSYPGLQSPPPGRGGRDMDHSHHAFNQGMIRGGAGGMNIGSELNNLNLGPMGPPPHMDRSGAMGGVSMGGGGGGLGGGLNTPAGIANLKGILHNSGYAEGSAQEIAQAMGTLHNYGLLGLGLGSTLFGNLMNLNKLSLGGGGVGGPPPVGGGAPVEGPPGGPGLLPSGGDSLMGGFGPGGGTGGGKSRFGPVGSSDGARDGSNGIAPGGLVGPLGGLETMYGGHMQGGPLGGPGGKGGFPPGSQGGGGFDRIQNKNSFGLGMESNAGGGGGQTETEEMEVAEGLVGSIIGQGGRNLQELQANTGSTIQISKKGEYAPGTHNRVIYVTGPPHVVQRTVAIVRQRLSEAETRRNSFTQGGAGGGGGGGQH